MPRTPRIVIPGAPHHITHRGNNKQVIFHSDFDCNQYLTLLRKYANKHDLSILGYCLMPNHIHIVAIPKHDRSMAKAIGSAHNIYARTTNQNNGKCGHLWQARHYSCPMDDEHLVAAMRYVEQNPVRAGIADRSVDYRWSSAMAHATGTDRKGIIEMDWWNKRFNPIEWHELLNETLDDGFVRNIRQKTKVGKLMDIQKDDILAYNTSLEAVALSG